MGQKRLIKKIRRLEARLQKGATKLANLKQKLRAVEAAKLAKAKRKSAAPPRKIPTLFGIPLPKEEKEELPTETTWLKQEGMIGGGSLKKVKKKRHITPERRAQLSAMMKARWAAKRAAATPQEHSPGQTSTSAESSPQ